METKKCNKCGVVKPLSEFYKMKCSKDGHRNDCKVCNNNSRDAHRRANIEKERARRREWDRANKDKKKAYCEKNKEKIRKRNKIYRQENKDYFSSYERNRKKNDPTYRLKSIVSVAVSAALKKQGTTKGGQTFSALPYTPADLVEHLEKQFDDKMSWDNYGTYWHLDHIYPQSLLLYDSLDHPNFQKCWALGNLQPLEKMENIRKSNKVIA